MMRRLFSLLALLGFPTIHWFEKGSKKEVAFEGDRSADGLISFVESKTGLKGVAPPKPKTFVRDLTEADFDAIALDPTKDVLVEFFAPW